jgi:hypothetical protein
VGQKVGVDGGGGRLPDADVAHDGGGKDEVSSDSGKVEGGDSEDETFEGPVLGSAARTGKIGVSRAAQGSAKMKSTVGLTSRYPGCS